MSKGLTLGQFRKLTADLHPDTEIVLDNGNDWYVDVDSIALPDGDGYCCVTLFGGEVWDTRFPADEPAELVNAPKNSEPVL